MNCKLFIARKISSIFLFLLIFYSCNGCKEKWTGIKDLGDNFGLIEMSAKNYCINYRENPPKGYYGYGTPVIPFRLYEYNFDVRWIIAKSVNEQKDTLFWIIDKEFVPNQYEI